MALRLLIGNKNYSSWSFRPWIAMKVAGIRFTEEVISLEAADFKERVKKISGTGGPFLFGRFGAADAMYAPIVSRFHTYGVKLGEVARAYVAAVMALPAWQEWRAAALKEPWVLPHDEPDWPTVHRLEA